jgi:hypothetical protein
MPPGFFITKSLAQVLVKPGALPISLLNASFATVKAGIKIPGHACCLPGFLVAHTIAQILLVDCLLPDLLLDVSMKSRVYVRSHA